MVGDTVKVLFIGGAARSGSTLLDRLLGQTEGFCSLGEMRHIWERSFRENQLCGCGRSFRECGFWGAVVEEAFGGFAQVPVNEIRALQRTVDRIRYVPVLAFPRVSSARYRERLGAYAEVLTRLYGAIGRVSGCRVLVDSSKDPSHGFVLSAVPRIHLFVVHLVRDSRAVAYSWQRRKLRYEIGERREYMRILSAPRSAFEWNVGNLLVEMLGRCAPQYRLVYYEELARSVEGTVRDLVNWVEDADVPLGFVDRVGARLGVNHTVAGNPVRFERGLIQIRPDLEWVERMGRRQRATVTALTWFLLRRLGYVGRAARNRGEGQTGRGPADGRLGLLGEEEAR